MKIEKEQMNDQYDPKSNDKENYDQPRYIITLNDGNIITIEDSSCNDLNRYQIFWNNKVVLSYDEINPDKITAFYNEEKDIWHPYFYYIYDKKVWNKVTRAIKDNKELHIFKWYLV